MTTNNIAFIRSNPILNNIEISYNYGTNWKNIDSLDWTIDASTLIFYSNIIIDKSISIKSTQNLRVSGCNFTVVISNVDAYQGLFSNLYDIEIGNLTIMVDGVKQNLMFNKIGSGKMSIVDNMYELITLHDRIIIKNFPSTVIMKNIVFVDTSIEQSDILLDSLNDESIGIGYDNYNTSHKIVELIKEIVNSGVGNNIERIGFVFDNCNMNNKKFVDNVNYFTNSDFKNEKYSSNVELILWILGQFPLKNVDWLACNSLNFSNWINYYNLIKLKTGLTIGASNDETGNIIYGGNWIMESTGEDIKNVYWNDSISNYTLTLNALTISSNGGTVLMRQIDAGSLVQYSINDGSSWITITAANFPVTFTNTSTTNTVMTVQFTTNMTLGSGQTGSAANGRFIIGSNNITIEGVNNVDGTKKIVTIAGFANYDGLFKNDPSTGLIGIIVQNLGITASNSTLSSLNSGTNTAGWLFGLNTAQNGGRLQIIGCYSNAAIATGCGGLIGSNSGATNGQITVSDSYSILDISSNGGGIFGRNASNSTTTNCYSQGAIANYAGGIFGSYATNCIASNCNSTGRINTQSGGIYGIYASKSSALNCRNTNSNAISTTAGGIFGRYASESSATNCYVTNNIGIDAGGIFGSDTNNSSATNCYSVGSINSNAGGIFGRLAQNSTATNCYSTGSHEGSGFSGGIFGREPRYSTASGCYSSGAINVTGAGGIFGVSALSSNAIKCYSTGTTGSTNVGAIFGQSASYCTASGCYSEGSLSSASGGGIYGSSTSNSNAINCYSIGNTGSSNVGGIFGQNASSCTASGCYSTGTLSSSSGGGIYGTAASNSSATNCYSLGNAGNTDVGGIFGRSANTCTATNCYSRGIMISTGNGGIFGSSSSNSTAINCYSTGLLLTPPNNGIFSISRTNPTITSCYAANGSWSDSAAAASLTGAPTYDGSGVAIKVAGTTWIDVNSSNSTTPWLFSTLGYSPYTTTLTSTYSQTIIIGNTSNGALNPTGHTYTIVAINDKLPSEFPTITINPNGSIKTTKDTQSGFYAIKVMQNSDYSITNFNLTVNVFCLLETTKILCLNNDKEEWIQIKDIDPNSQILVKTYLHGYKKVVMNKRFQLINTTKKTKHRLYVLKQEKSNELFEDLYMSGQHGILVDECDFINKVGTDKKINKIDDKVVLMAWMNKDCEAISNNENYSLHHLILENSNSNGQYGIYANGILTETMSIHKFKNIYKQKIVKK